MNQSDVAYRSVPISFDLSRGDFDAVALYDNQSEGPDELDFKKGDVLKILERDFNGLIGWWLCALGDRIGLAPGNRLETVGPAPDKPQNLQRFDATLVAKGKVNDAVYKQPYGPYDVPKIEYDLSPKQQQQHQQQQQKQHQQMQHQQQKQPQSEIPDILKGQNVHGRSNSNPERPEQPESTVDAYVWPEDANRIPRQGKTVLPASLLNTNNNYNNSISNNNNNSNNGGNSWTDQETSPRPGAAISVSTFSNLLQPMPTTFNQTSSGSNSNVDSQQQQRHYHQQQQHQQQNHHFQQPQYVIHHISTEGDLHRSLCNRNNNINNNIKIFSNSNSNLNNISSSNSNNSNKMAVYSECDNYDNLVQRPPVPVQLLNPPTVNEGFLFATTNSNMNKFNASNSINSGRYLTVAGSQTLQHRPRRDSREEQEEEGDKSPRRGRLVVRDDTALETRAKVKDAPGAVTKGKRDRSLRRVRFADQVSSSDTEEWTRNGDALPNPGAVPLKPILSSSSPSSSSSSSSSFSSSSSSIHQSRPATNYGPNPGGALQFSAATRTAIGNPMNGHSNNCASNSINNSNININNIGHLGADDCRTRYCYRPHRKEEDLYDDNVPDYENPYSEIADQPIYERPSGPPSSGSSSSSSSSYPRPNSAKASQFTAEYKTLLNGRDPAGGSLYSNCPQSLGSKKFDGVFISSPVSRPTPTPPLSSSLLPPPPPPPPVLPSPADEPEFQLRFLDVPERDPLSKGEREILLLPSPSSSSSSSSSASAASARTIFSPDLLARSRDNLQLLAGSLDGILGRRNVDDAGVAALTLRSMDAELGRLVDVCERALKRAIETWSEELIESLLGHVEDLRTVRARLALLAGQVSDLAREAAAVGGASGGGGGPQRCRQAFETICSSFSSCALSGRDVCQPVRRFTAYLLPKFRFLFPTSPNDVGGRLAPSPTFNGGPSPFPPSASSSAYSTMTTGQLKSRLPEAPSSVPKGQIAGRQPSPIPRMESVPAYGGRSLPPAEAALYEDLGLHRAPQEGGRSHASHYQKSSSDANISQPSQSVQGRPLPPAPPPSYSSVVRQPPHDPRDVPCLPSNPRGPSSTLARLHPARESPIFNAYGGDGP